MSGDPKQAVLELGEKLSPKEFLAFLTNFREWTNKLSQSGGVDSVAIAKQVAGVSQERGHFVQELLQNADDCDYPEGVEEKVHMHVFKLSESSWCLFLYKNEVGFTRENVFSITGLAASTKASSSNTIGKKGIGFKSIFEEFTSVSIFSNGFQFRMERSNPLTPRWCEVDEWKDCSFAAKLLANYYGKREQKGSCLLALTDVEPKMLVDENSIRFLQKTRNLLVRKDCNTWLIKLKVEDFIDRTFEISKCDAKGEQETEEKKFWRIRRETDVDSSILENCEEERLKAYKMKKRVAFALDFVDEPNPKGQMYAFLPIKNFTCGFPFHFNADWIMLMSREDIVVSDKHSLKWNSWLIEQLHFGFVKAYEQIFSERLGVFFRCFPKVPSSIQSHEFKSAVAAQISKIHETFKRTKCLLGAAEDGSPVAIEPRVGRLLQGNDLEVFGKYRFALNAVDNVLYFCHESVEMNEQTTSVLEDLGSSWGRDWSKKSQTLIRAICRITEDKRYVPSKEWSSHVVQMLCENAVVNFVRRDGKPIWRFPPEHLRLLENKKILWSELGQRAFAPSECLTRGYSATPTLTEKELLDLGYHWVEDKEIANRLSITSIDWKVVLQFIKKEGALEEKLKSDSTWWKRACSLFVAEATGFGVSHHVKAVLEKEKWVLDNKNQLRCPNQIILDDGLQSIFPISVLQPILGDFGYVDKDRDLHRDLERFGCRYASDVLERHIETFLKKGGDDLRLTLYEFLGSSSISWKGWKIFKTLANEYVSFSPHLRFFGELDAQKDLQRLSLNMSSSSIVQYGTQNLSRWRKALEKFGISEVNSDLIIRDICNSWSTKEEEVHITRVRYLFKHQDLLDSRNKPGLRDYEFMVSGVPQVRFAVGREAYCPLQKPAILRILSSASFIDIDKYCDGDESKWNQFFKKHAGAKLKPKMKHVLLLEKIGSHVLKWLENCPERKKTEFKRGVKVETQLHDYRDARMEFVGFADVVPKDLDREISKFLSEQIPTVCVNAPKTYGSPLNCLGISSKLGLKAVVLCMNKWYQGKVVDSESYSKWKSVMMKSNKEDVRNLECIASNGKLWKPIDCGWDISAFTCNGSRFNLSLSPIKDFFVSVLGLSLGSVQNPNYPAMLDEFMSRELLEDRELLALMELYSKIYSSKSQPSHILVSSKKQLKWVASSELFYFVDRLDLVEEFNCLDCNVVVTTPLFSRSNARRYGWKILSEEIKEVCSLLDKTKARQVSQCVVPVLEYMLKGNEVATSWMKGLKIFRVDQEMLVDVSWKSSGKRVGSFKKDIFVDGNDVYIWDNEDVSLSTVGTILATICDVRNEEQQIKIGAVIHCGATMKIEDFFNFCVGLKYYPASEVKIPLKKEVSKAKLVSTPSGEPINQEDLEQSTEEDVANPVSKNPPTKEDAKTDSQVQLETGNPVVIEEDESDEDDELPQKFFPSASTISLEGWKKIYSKSSLDEVSDLKEEISADNQKSNLNVNVDLGQSFEDNSESSEKLESFKGFGFRAPYQSSFSDDRGSNFGNSYSYREKESSFRNATSYPMQSSSSNFFQEAFVDKPSLSSQDVKEKSFPKEADRKDVEEEENFSRFDLKKLTTDEIGEEGEKKVFSWLKRENFLRLILHRDDVFAVAQKGEDHFKICTKENEDFGCCKLVRGTPDIVIEIGGVKEYLIEVKASGNSSGFSLSPNQWAAARIFREKFFVVYIPNIRQAKLSRSVIYRDIYGISLESSVENGQVIGLQIGITCNPRHEGQFACSSYANEKLKTNK